MNRYVEVQTHGRLHFGLTSLGHDTSKPQFGGAGVMTEAPGTALRITPDSSFRVSGSLCDRVTEVVARLAEQWRLPLLPEVHIEVVTAPREHVGLGVGTQLALAVAAGLGEALGFAWRDPLRLAQLTQRGRRSAVGTYGFLQGGFIVDAGHRQGEALGKLMHRCEFPADWRFVLFIPQQETGCSGRAEERAFARLPSMPLGVTAALESIAMTKLAPAIATHDFDAFSEGLYRYGSLAGECFSAVQGGSFCSPRTATLIDWLRGVGVAGVGQSSWGPTVFALAANQGSAERLAELFACYSDRVQYRVLITPAASQGAAVTARDPISTLTHSSS